MSHTPSVVGAELAKIIQSEPARGRFRILRWLIVTVVFALAGGGFLWFRSGSAVDAAPQYQTEPLGQGNLRVTVSATGKLAPINQVDVGSELSGTIETVLVDDNDRVKKGQVLARLDLTKLQNQIAKSKAALASAEAKVLQTVATVKESRANLGRLRQVAKLSGGKVPAPTELETAEATVDRAVADEASARAAVEEARATLRTNETDLAKASIRSPIDGVVLSRAVEPGNAVAASLQAVTLFTLAEDLAKMKLQVNVDEADVGQVRAGQRASFTVSAYPTRRYPAHIVRVGYGPTTKDNVVTYLAELSVNNDDLSLRPGMTATATITTVEHADVLLVPNAALRWMPAAAGAAPAANNRSSLVGSMMPRPPGSRPARSAGTDIAQVRQVWVLDGGTPRAVPVTPGVSDGRLTEVTSEQLQPGMAVIVGQTSGAAR